MGAARATRHRKAASTRVETHVIRSGDRTARLWRIAVAALASIFLIGLFSTGIADTDFWWHLRTGQYIVQKHALPVADPFAYTTALSAPAYRGEEVVRHFNLTHEWLSQAAMYLVYAAGGLPAIIFTRALLLTALCGLTGFLSGRATRNWYVGIAAAFATASVAIEFTADRPAIVSFLCVALFVTALELRRWLWALPPLALLWANSHGAFFLGWIVLLAYCVETLPLPWRVKSDRPNSRRLWLVTVCSIAVSGINPNGFRVVSTLVSYRRSAMTANLVEWHPPSLWGPPYGFDILLYAAATVLIVRVLRRGAMRDAPMPRPAHWILFAAFAAASLLAFRNILLVGFFAPILIAAYFPYCLRMPRAVEWAAAPLVGAILLAGAIQGSLFRFGVAQWIIPEGAADYVRANGLTGALFNTYEQGGYLIWKLWPQERVFIDGRSLSESVYRDYQQILFNKGSYADQVAGPRAQLLDRYGVQLVVMNALDQVSGALYPLALALANPNNADWQLVYEDERSVVFRRHPPAGSPVIANKFGTVLNHLDKECAAYIDSAPDMPLCARTLGDYWMRFGVKDRARRMLQLYLSHAHKPDVQAEQALQRLETGA